MIIKWDDKLIVKFLNLYEKHSCLWNPYDQRFNDCSVKNLALQKIVQDLNKPGLKIEHCLRQLKSIRKKYSEEQSKIIQGLKSEISYRTVVPWYGLMTRMLMKVIKDERIKMNNVNLKTMITTKSKRKGKEQDVGIKCIQSIGRRNEESITKKDKKHLLDCPCWDSGDDKSNDRKKIQPTVNLVSCPYFQIQSNSSNSSEKVASSSYNTTGMNSLESIKKGNHLNDIYDMVPCPNYAKYVAMKESSNNYYNVRNSVCANAIDNGKSNDNVYNDYLNISKTVCTNIINKRYEKPISKQRVQSVQVGGQTRNETVGTSNCECCSREIQVSKTSIREEMIQCEGIECVTKGTQYNDTNNKENVEDFVLLTPSGKYIPLTRMKSVEHSVSANVDNSENNDEVSLNDIQNLLRCLNKISKTKDPIETEVLRASKKNESELSICEWCRCDTSKEKRTKDFNNEEEVDQTAQVLAKTFVELIKCAIVLNGKTETDESKCKCEAKSNEMITDLTDLINTIEKFAGKILQTDQKLENNNKYIQTSNKPAITDSDERGSINR